jgi:hypothetical protein
MSRLTSKMQQSVRSLMLWPLAVLALAASACGVDSVSDSAESGLQASVRKEALDTEPCTVTQTSSPPTLTVSQDLFVLKCDKDVWEPPTATATDACGRPLQVYRYNTGDDDGDGIPGSIDPDDFGPGPDTSTEGLYYVQYLAWDDAYNISGTIVSVYVVKCHKQK